MYGTFGDDLPLTVHLHDTRGLGIANALAALETGVRRFDASLAGLGGCPYAPGATGNIVMDDLVFMIQELMHQNGTPFRVLDCPFDAGEPTPTRPGPELGQDTDDLLAELGYDATGIARLREKGTV